MRIEYTKCLLIQKLNGCQLLENLHVSYDHGDIRLKKIINK